MSVFRFKPTKKIANDGGEGIPNGVRARNGEEMVKHVLVFGENDKDTAVVDALANIFHLCDRDHVDVDEAIRMAKMHWEQER